MHMSGCHIFFWYKVRTSMILVLKFEALTIVVEALSKCSTVEVAVVMELVRSTTKMKEAIVSGMDKEII